MYIPIPFLVAETIDNCFQDVHKSSPVNITATATPVNITANTTANKCIYLSHYHLV